MKQRYLTFKEAMEYTGMGRETLAFFLHEFSVPIFQASKGTRRFIDSQDIDKAFKKAKNLRNTESNSWY